MAEWLYEAGIGENRAALVEHDGAQDQILAVRIERPSDGIRYGAVAMARLVEPGLVEIDYCGKLIASLEGRAPVPPGGRFLVEVIRMATKERGRDKLARVRFAGENAVMGDGPSLFERISVHPAPVIQISSLIPGVDRLEAAGWSDMIDSARRGHWVFDSGALWIDPTPAMLVIDIDGEGQRLALARAGARACVAAIEAFDIGGPIGIDFPSLGGRGERAEVDALVDALLPLPFERTATNGFGFMQIIRRRNRPSFIEQVRFDLVRTDAALLLRQAERARGVGALTLRARPAVTDLLRANPDWLDQVQHMCGRSVVLQADVMMKGAGHAQ